MSKATLVIMAAGLGSRFGGGIKQLEPVGPGGEIIMDYSIYDAIEVGFDKVVFVIRKDLEDTFREVIGKRIEKQVDVAYAFQEVEDIPEKYRGKFSGRTKPWGTGQAILCCKDLVDTPFLVINADDYYGKHAFEVIYNYLTTHEDDDKYRYTMVGYRLKNTVTDNGHVARGICELNENKELVKVTERTRIEKRDGGIAYSEDDGETWVDVDGDTLVSMNMWGFTRSILDEIQAEFPAFLEKGLKENPLKCEYFLPSVVSRLLEEDRATVAVLESEDKWYGVTYKEDKPVVVAAMQELKDAGVYPQKLWEE